MGRRRVEAAAGLGGKEMPWTGKGKNVPIQNITDGRWIIFVKTWKPQQVKVGVRVL